MTQMIAFASFRRGVGRSALVANLAVLLAKQGNIVGLLDLNLRSPSLHDIFPSGSETAATINDFLHGKIEINATIQALTPKLGADPKGQLWFVAASGLPHEIAATSRYGYDAAQLDDGLATFSQALDLDLLFVELNAGLDEEILRAMVLADSVAIVLRHDQQNYQGAAVMVDIAQRLGVRPLLIVNELPTRYDADAVATQVESAVGCPVIGVIHHDESLNQDGLLVLREPQHPLIQHLQSIAQRLIAPPQPRL